MRRIVSLKGKIYELVELPQAEISTISIANGYEIPLHFISRFENWQAQINGLNRVLDCSPIRPPRSRKKPIMLSIGATKRGRPPLPKDPNKISTSAPKKRKKRRSKYGFEKIRIKNECIFVEGEAYRVAAAAAYFGSKYSPPRKYSVHKAKMGGVKGSRVEWVD